MLPSKVNIVVNEYTQKVRIMLYLAIAITIVIILVIIAVTTAIYILAYLSALYRPIFETHVITLKK